MDALFDTSILIDCLNGIEHARDELRRYRWASISPIPFVEVLVGASPAKDAAVRIPYSLS